MIGIYKIENLINHKVYIGQTVDYTRRVYLHTHYLMNNRHINTHLQNAWNKYGSDNFKFELICDFTNEFEQYDRVTQDKVLNEAEVFWIKQFKATDENFGYNLSEGGDGATLFGERNGSYGKKKSVETRNKISATINKNGSHSGSKNGRYGKEVSSETRTKISLANKGRVQSPEERNMRSVAMRAANAKPENIKRRELRKTDPSRKQLYKDIGAKNRKYTDDFIESLRSEYALGKSVDQLSEKYSLRRKLVMEVVHRNGHFKNR